MSKALILVVLLAGCERAPERLTAEECVARSARLDEIEQRENEFDKLFPEYVGTERWLQSRSGDSELRAIHWFYCGRG